MVGEDDEKEGVRSDTFGVKKRGGGGRRKAVKSRRGREREGRRKFLLSLK